MCLAATEFCARMAKPCTSFPTHNCIAIVLPTVFANQQLQLRTRFDLQDMGSRGLTRSRCTQCLNPWPRARPFSLQLEISCAFAACFQFHHKLLRCGASCTKCKITSVRACSGEGGHPPKTAVASPLRRGCFSNLGRGALGVVRRVV